MQTAVQKSVDTVRARQLWQLYESNHDLSGRLGYVAAIEPNSGQIWIAHTGVEVADQIEADGCSDPVYLVRIGESHFVRKGRR